MRKILSIILALTLLLSLTACGSPAATETTAPTAGETVPQESGSTVITGVEDGVLTVGMECAYAPYNWTQTDDSNGAVPISNVPGAYANGYDVMIAKKICRTVTKNLCEALSMAVRYARCAPCRIPMNRLTKRFIFYSPTGRAFPEIEKRG